MVAVGTVDPLPAPQVADAFVWRPPAPRPLERPSAPDFLLAEACASARRYREHRARGPAAASTKPQGFLDVAHCML